MMSSARGLEGPLDNIRIGRVRLLRRSLWAGAPDPQREEESFL
jgi:hypothetical protein